MSRLQKYFVPCRIVEVNVRTKFKIFPCQVARLVCYSCHLVSGSKLLPPGLSASLSRLAGQLSVWRATSRLADGPLLLRHVLHAGLAGGEEDWLTGLLQVLVLDSLYFL